MQPNISKLGIAAASHHLSSMRLKTPKRQRNPRRCHFITEQWSKDPVTTFGFEQNARQLAAELDDPGFPACDNLTEQARRFIWSNSPRLLNIQQVAEAVGVSRRTLERRFTRKAGRTVRQELEWHRAHRAQSLLRETHRPIKEIAFLCGFRKQRALVRAFKRWHGLIPSEIRNRKPNAKPILAYDEKQARLHLRFACVDLKIPSMQLRILHLISKVFSGFRVVMVLVMFMLLVQSREAQADDETNLTLSDWLKNATNHLGSWIWDTNTFDKQTVRFWNEFTIPAGTEITNAIIRITVDNGYTLYLDGEEIGRGSDWRTLTEYNVTQLLEPGRHNLVVDSFNDRLEGGLIFRMKIEAKKQPVLELVSDNTWIIISPSERNWIQKKYPDVTDHPVRVIGPVFTRPWEHWPYGFASVPPLHPIVIHFWERGWFQLILLASCLLALLICLFLMTRLTAQARAQEILQIERVRIARDIHDDLGAQLTQLLLMGEVAQREQLADSPASGQFAQICDRARELAQALDEVVWAVNSRRDTVHDFVSYVCKYAQMFLQPTNIRCRLDVESEMPATLFELPVRRNLFLAVKEALNNAAKHSQAEELHLRIYRRDQKLSVIVEDDGVGFDLTLAVETGNGLTNMVQRMNEIGGTCEVYSKPEGGCLMLFTIPLPEESRGWFRRKPVSQAY
jgi:signal transduction histidine kinase/AraC-like DNA-binding protein